MTVALIKDDPNPLRSNQSDPEQPWRPPSFAGFAAALQSSPLVASRQLDHTFQLTFHTLTNLNALINATRFGKATVTGSLTQLPTGLASVTDCTATIDSGSAAHNFWISVQPSALAGAIDIFVWKPTAAGNTTPIAATTAVSVRWSAHGST